MTLTLHFLRHGQTELSRQDVFCGSGLDPKLTSEGAEMAQAFATVAREKTWAAIYSSGLRRAIATAQPVCEGLGLELQTRPELNEIAYGKWEGLSKKKVEHDYHDDYISWLADPAWHPPTEGEPAVVIARRGLMAIEEIKGRCSDGNVLIVSHKATIRIILCSLLGIDVGRFRYRLVCPVGSVSTIEFTPEGPLLAALADRSHLSERLRSLPGT
jgi:probable phosphoglycerate mutase